jgi:hypothetical protein
MLIGLSAKKQSGKSTVAGFLKNIFDFQELSWAYPLKEIIGRQLFGLGDDVLYGDSPAREEVIPLWGMSGRSILQKVGTDLFRENFDPDFWVKIGVEGIKKSMQNNRHVVVSDCRFPNEIKAIKELGGHSCRIIRLGFDTNDEHLSETALQDDAAWDFKLIATSGDLQSLLRKTKDMVNVLREDSYGY